MQKYILLLLMVSNLQGKDSPLCGKHEEVGKLSRLVESSVKVGRVLLVPVKFAYNNSEKILSKKMLAFIAIIGAPYFYCNPDALSSIAQLGANTLVKMNGLIARGVLEGLMSNPAALANFMALMTAQSTGAAFIKGFGEKLSTALLTLFTL